MVCVRHDRFPFTSEAQNDIAFDLTFVNRKSEMESSVAVINAVSPYSHLRAKTTFGQLDVAKYRRYDFLMTQKN